MIFSGQWCFPSSFENGKFCIDVGLGQGNVKQPDAHWTVRPHMLLNPQQIQNPFAINPASNRIAPELVYEVVVSNKSMPTLTVTDLNWYFGPGTATRACICSRIEIRMVFIAGGVGGRDEWLSMGNFVDLPAMSNEIVADQTELQCRPQPSHKSSFPYRCRFACRSIACTARLPPYTQSRSRANSSMHPRIYIIAVYQFEQGLLLSDILWSQLICRDKVAFAINEKYFCVFLGSVYGQKL